MKTKDLKWDKIQSFIRTVNWYQAAQNRSGWKNQGRPIYSGQKIADDDDIKYFNSQFN